MKQRIRLPQAQMSPGFSVLSRLVLCAVPHLCGRRCAILPPICHARQKVLLFSKAVNAPIHGRGGAAAVRRRCGGGGFAKSAPRTAKLLAAERTDFAFPLAARKALPSTRRPHRDPPAREERRRPVGFLCPRARLAICPSFAPASRSVSAAGPSECHRRPNVA